MDSFTFRSPLWFPPRSGTNKMWPELVMADQFLTVRCSDNKSNYSDWHHTTASSENPNYLPHQLLKGHGKVGPPEARLKHVVRKLPERLLMLYLFCGCTNGSHFYSYQITTKFISIADLKQQEQNPVCANINHEREHTVNISLLSLGICRSS